MAIAPIEIMIIPLDIKNKELMDLSVSIYEQLSESGYDVVLDDRKKTPGFKFKDCQLLGCPLRIVVNKNSLIHQTIEISLRKTGEIINTSLNNFFDESLKKIIEKIK